MHTHNSAVFFVTTFIGVLLLTTLWRVTAANVAKRNPELAAAMVTQL